MNTRLAYTLGGLAAIGLAGALAVAGRGGGHGAPGTDGGAPTSLVSLAEAYELPPTRLALRRDPEGAGSEPSAKTGGAPVRLTASDGTGLALTELRADAVVVNPLAYTQLRLVFENPEYRVIEGTFAITLPPGAAVSRFAMWTNDHWQEGEVVEKQRARAVYEDFLHRKQDPALLEQGAGNEFTARVFPIPARGKKELVIAYSQELVGDAPYVLGIKGLPQVGKLEVDVTSGAGGPSVHAMREERFVPKADVVIDRLGRDAAGGLRSGDLALVRLRPMAAAEEQPVPQAIVLVDTSASRALGFEAELALVEGVVGAMARGGERTRVEVALFDQEVEPLYDGAAGDFGAKELAKVRARGALGASDVGAALKWARGRAKESGAKRVVLMSDGVATAGDDGAALREIARSLKDSGVERIDAVAVGGLRDEDGLRHVVAAGLASDGVVIDSARGAREIARRLRLPTRSGLAVAFEGARWAWPRKLDGVQPGDEVLAYVELSGDAPVHVSVGGEPAKLGGLSRVARPLLERAWARAKIASLADANEGALAAETRAEAVKLATRHRIVTPYTSLLVLETEQDYARFGLDRRALADILTIDDGKLALLQRTGGASPAKTQTATRDEKKREMAPPPPPSERGEGARRADEDREATGPAGAPAARPRNAPAAQAEADPVDLGLAASKGGNAPAAEAPARAAAAAPPAAPAPRAAAPDLDMGAGGAPPRPGQGAGGLAGIGGSVGASTGSGAGTMNTVRGPTGDAIVGAATGSVAGVEPMLARLRPRFKACFNRGLATDPTMSGRMVVQVRLSEDGAVTAADVTSNSGLSTDVAECVRSAVKRAEFAPGAVTFSFPLSFVRRDDAPPVAVRPAPERAAPPQEPSVDPYQGRLREVMGALKRGDTKAALATATTWHDGEPGDVLGLVALGAACEASGDAHKAARAYGSVIDLFASRADLRRFAGERLEHIKEPWALALAIDTYAKATRDRPDHPSSHRLLAYARLKAGDYQGAFDAAFAGASRSYPSGRFAGADRILKEDLGLVAAAWARAVPNEADAILQKMRDAGGTRENGPSLRFVLNWETDANDVDFHIHDDRGGHAYYSSPSLPSGGDLYADVTTGYGPECFTVRLPPEQRPKYTLQAHYYSRGPMGYGMGKLQVIEHDGKGGLTFDERPFIVMVDRAFVDMGKVDHGLRR